MSFGGSYRNQLETILRAVKTNLQRITLGNGFQTEVVAVHERDTPIRPGTYTGATIKVTDIEDVQEYRPGREALATLSYHVEGFLPNQEGDTLRAALRRFVDDFLAAHYSDVYLVAADLANGGAGTRLVGAHRVNKIVRQYVFPNAYFRAEVALKFFWSAEATT